MVFNHYNNTHFFLVGEEQFYLEELILIIPKKCEMLIVNTLMANLKHL